MLAVGVILGLFFVRRFLESYKVMPAGLMSVLRYVILEEGFVDFSAFVVFKYSRELGVF